MAAPTIPPFGPDHLLLIDPGSTGLFDGPPGRHLGSSVFHTA